MAAGSQDAHGSTAPTAADPSKSVPEGGDSAGTAASSPLATEPSPGEVVPVVPGQVRHSLTAATLAKCFELRAHAGDRA